MDSQTTPRRRAYWLKTLHQWHWISSALCLLGMLLFAITGLTLNNASLIESKAVVNSHQAQLPEPVLKQLTVAAGQKKAPLPAPVAQWLDDALGASTAGKTAEWSADEVYLSLPRAGGDAWLSIDRSSGEVEYERTDRGWVSYLNDLHKGRHTGLAWSWFLDIFALACLVFSLTGLVLLKMHAGNRSATWPMVGLGIVIPVVLALLFIH
ncbi:PepSY-associated TM helix domain-containing protein [Achromobacter seleniivolatilans]|uniref:PepSY-associated TM helix domain-containing protein n=1 Tax=Achromobacter seleniivolatilans TaxID=3047478 RepID=A0ABY9M2P4_9BURK|nr:PepSY-associated TM helix domain-containing protein [Achromobacter sp. R39]WMD21264.1 PepSY-associated TM helix domain-containing protein [Achromobacter sp. R39]